MNICSLKSAGGRFRVTLARFERPPVGLGWPRRARRIGFIATQRGRYWLDRSSSPRAAKQRYSRRRPVTRVTARAVEMWVPSYSACVAHNLGVQDLLGSARDPVMKPETFTRVAKLSDLNGAGPFALSARGADIVLLKAGGRWRAFEGRCPHQGALLGEGELDGAPWFAGTIAGVSQSSPDAGRPARNVWRPARSSNATTACLSTSLALSDLQP